MQPAINGVTGKQMRDVAYDEVLFSQWKKGMADEGIDHLACVPSVGGIQNGLALKRDAQDTR